jgi:hypothetical protein
MPHAHCVILVFLATEITLMTITPYILLLNRNHHILAKFCGYALALSIYPRSVMHEKMGIRESCIHILGPSFTT